MSEADDPNRSLRWTIYWLLILAAAASSTGRIFSVTPAGRDPQTPFLSANDRSRWAMIRALVDEGRFEIDDVIFDPATGKRVNGWHTIDLVKHKGRDGREHYYSSKPVLMPTLMAGVYWIVKQATGASLTTNPFHAGRLVLWLCNIPPLVLMGWLLARMIDRASRSDWTRLFAMTAATFGTFLTTFSITLNNHLHAAVCVTIVAYSLLRTVSDNDRSWRHFALAGLFAALTFANELPALSLLALVAAAVLWFDWRKTLLGFVPVAAVVLVAMAALNYVAHGSLRPPYTHRHDGQVIAQVEFENRGPNDINTVQLRRAVVEKLSERVIDNAMLTPRMQVNPGQNIAGRFMLWDELRQERFAVNVVSDRFVEIREWDNWYEYEGTYWTVDNKRGVDLGEPSKLVYAFHCLVGHHGLFSLTPLWLVAFGGMFLAFGNSGQPLRPLLLGTLLLSVVCLGFYLFIVPIQDRNYGGVTNGLRWMMWFIPLYLLAMLPALDRLAQNRWGRAFALACLALSIFSAAYKPMNPWSHPWLFDYWQYLGWIGY